MQARRILLVVAILLLVTTVAGSLVQAPDESAPERPPVPEAGDAPPREPTAGDELEHVRFRVGGRPSGETVALERHVIVTVEANAPGEVELVGLGRVQPVEPRTPAVFDLFTDRAGSFDVRYAPVSGGGRRVGTLTVERRPSGEDS